MSNAEMDLVSEAHQFMRTAMMESIKHGVSGGKRIVRLWLDEVEPRIVIVRSFGYTCQPPEYNGQWVDLYVSDDQYWANWGDNFVEGADLESYIDELIYDEIESYTEKIKKILMDVEAIQA